jgi:hypothetical protein
MICGCVSSPESFRGWLISNIPFGTKSALDGNGKAKYSCGVSIVQRRAHRVCWNGWQGHKRHKKMLDSNFSPAHIYLEKDGLHNVAHDTMNKHRNIIFAILLVLLLLAGIGWQYELHSMKIRGVEFGSQLREWIPEATPLASAQQILEQHRFICSVVSYDNIRAITNNPDAVQWTQNFILENRKTEAVTNISVLNCHDKQKRYSAGWVAINNRTLGLMWWTVTGK